MCGFIGQAQLNPNAPAPGGRERGGGREAAGRGRTAGTPARACAGRGPPPSLVALITFVLVLREGETSAQPALGFEWGGRHRPGPPGDEGSGQEWGRGENGKGVGGCQLQLRSGSIVRDLMG